MPTTGGPALGGGHEDDQSSQDRVPVGEGPASVGEGPVPLTGRSATEVRQRRVALLSGAVAVLLVAVAAVALTRFADGGGADGDDPGAGPAAAPSTTPPSAAAVLQTVATVPVSVLDAVGRGDVFAEPRRVDDQPALSEGGKPLVLYFGAEYCPYCASQRWSAVVALSRFGTFTNLELSHSASGNGDPGIQTFTFHGATYTSQYLAFQGVEVASSERLGDGYAPLDQLTEQQRQIVSTMNAPPYVSADSAGAIPFLDFGNKYVLVGSSYDVRLLQGKSAEQIAAALRDPQDPIAQAVLGTANLFTAMICQLTGGQPAEACRGPAVNAYQNGL